MAQYNVTFDELDSFLGSLSENTVDTPYDICITEITAEQCVNGEEEDTVRYVLCQNPSKYIDLSFAQLPPELTDTTSMFYGCTSLVHIDVSNFTNITNTNAMFYGCSSLELIDASEFVNVYSASVMFKDCISLKSIDASGFINTEIINNMFGGCTSLKTIDKFGFDIAKITKYGSSMYGNMFYGCTSLTDVYCESFVIPKPYDGSTINIDGVYNEVVDFFENKLHKTDITIHKNDSYQYLIFTPFVYLNRLLQQLPENTIDTSYEVEITEITKEQCTNNSSKSVEGTLKYVLRNNGKKYLRLSFTELPSDFTNADYMFYYCSSLTSIDTFEFTNVTNAEYMFSYCSSLTSIDTSAFTNVTNAGSMFYSCTSLTSIDTYAFTKVTEANYMFNSCSSLTSINNFNFNLDILKTHSNMFYNCSEFNFVNFSLFYSQFYDGSSFNSKEQIENFIHNTQNLPNVVVTQNPLPNPVLTPFVHLDRLLTQLPENTAGDPYTPGEPYNIEITEITKEQCTNRKSSATEDTLRYVLLQNRTKYISLSFSELPEDFTDASYMFYLSTNLTEIDTSGFVNVTNASNMFYGCYNLKEIDTSSFINVTDTTYMFWSCRALTEINTSGFVNVITANGMFSSCYNLEEIDTSGFVNVTNAESMFEACDKLEGIDTSSFINVTNAVDMFYYCRNLKEIDASSFVNVTNADYMFRGCTALTKINNFRFSISNLTSSEEMFEGCTSLQEITVPKPIEKTTNPSLLNFSKSGNNLTVKYFPLNSDSVSEVTVEADDTVTLTGVTDELLIDTSIDDELIEKMRDYKRKWSTDNRVLDPSKKNFVVWADEESNVVQNIVKGGGTNVVYVTASGTVEIDTSYESTKLVIDSSGADITLSTTTDAYIVQVVTLTNCTINGVSYSADSVFPMIYNKGWKVANVYGAVWN